MSHILKDVADGVMRLTLNRPEKKNALTPPMYGQLADALIQADAAEDVRVVLLLGGESFTVGNDIGDFVQRSEAVEPPKETPNVQRFLEGIAQSRKSVVAGVRGHAVGVGVTLLLHCDLVYVAEDAKLSTPFVGLGLVPEAGSTLLMPMRVGHARAFEILVLGETVSGAQAAAWGLANRALPAAEVDAAARAAARALAARPPTAVLASRALLKSTDAVLQRMREESVIFAERLKGPEAKAAFQAFADRRPRAAAE